MRSIALAALGGILVMMSGHRVAAQQHAPVTVIRTYTGSDGQAHIDQIDMKLTPAAQVDRLEVSERIKATGVSITRSAPGNVHDWHPAPGRRYVITLSGRGEVEAAGGQKIVLVPGRIFLAEDVTGKGHITRTVGSEDWVALNVYLADTP